MARITIGLRLSFSAAAGILVATATFGSDSTSPPHSSMETRGTFLVAQTDNKEKKAETPQTKTPKTNSDSSKSAQPKRKENADQSDVKNAPPPSGKQKPKAAAAPVTELQCVSASEVPDADGDFKRNLEFLKSQDLCIRVDVFKEGNLEWVLQIIQNRKRPNGPLWAVPHDNEDAAFDTAVYAVKKYGGTIVAVETGGKRFNKSQDPNRNFDAGVGDRCPEQLDRSPIYTARYLRWMVDGQPIIALHTNGRGYEGDNKGGQGQVTIAKKSKGVFPFRSLRPLNSNSPDDTLIYVSSLESPNSDFNLMRFVNSLNSRGINVLYERVSRKNDCSMSNYAALKGLRDYVNVEVVHGDSGAQQRMVDIIVELLGASGIGPAMQKTEKPESSEEKVPQRSEAPSPRLHITKIEPELPPGKFAIDLGEHTSRESLEIAWSKLISAMPASFEGQKPVVREVRFSDGSLALHMQLGPYSSGADAENVCVAVWAQKLPCEVWDR
jgi:hypothetical protein